MAIGDALRRFPAKIIGGNGLTFTYANGVWTGSVNLQNLTITPTGAAAPLNLADTMANLIAQYSGTKNIINISDGCWDIPNSGNGYSANDGSF